MSTEDQGIYTEPSSSQRDSIRPSLNDLRNTANYDADALQWPSSAKVSKGVVPPAIASRQKAATSSSSKSKGKAVRIAEPTEDDIRYYQPQPRAREDAPQPWHVSAQHDPSPTTEGSEFDNMTPGRFVLPLQGENGESSSSAGANPLPAMPSLPMVGGVQERKPAGASQSTGDSAPSKSSLPPASSRFKAMKQAERQAGEQGQTGDPLAASKRQHAPPIVKSRIPPVSQRVAPSHSSQYLNDDDVPRAQRDPNAIASSASNDDEEWLDEDGNVMSAFRKARLQKQGADPPGGKRRKVEAANGQGLHDTVQGGIAPSQDDPSSAHDEDATSLSRENEDKIKSMSPADVQSSVAELQSVISPDLLEQLKNRNHAATNAPQRVPSSDAPDVKVDSMLKEISLENEKKIKAMKAEDVASDLQDLQMMFGKDILDGLRERKSGGKAKARVSDKPSESAAKTTQPTQTPSSSSQTPSESTHRPPKSPVSGINSILFDPMGKLLPTSSNENDHSHDHEGHAHPHADAEGYSVESLLLLCRSTVPGQRIMALSMISRVCSLYSPRVGFGDKVSSDKLKLEPGSTPSLPVVATLLRKAETHVNTAITAVMLLNDRQRSVRHAALSALRTAMLFGDVHSWVKPTGKGPSTKDDDSKSPSAIQRLLETGLFSGLLNVLQDKNELMVSRELVVQILLQLIRTAHKTADALLRYSSGKLVSSLVQCCLKTHWPPAAESTSTASRYPSPACVTLLHEIVKSSRNNAEDLIKRDTLDVLLRFVAVGPWTIGGAGEDAPREQTVGYELLLGSLSIYHSLARYGLYASLVSRAWDLLEPIQEYVRQYTSTSQCDNQGRHLKHLQSLTASQFYHLLSIWTTCALDPHQTTPEHEVTWSQVQEWIEPSLDLMQDLLTAGNAGIHVKEFAALCEHVVAWLDCAAKNGPQRRETVVQRLSGLLSTHRASLLGQLRRLTSPAYQAPAEQESNGATSDDDDAEEQDDIQHERLAGTCDVLLQLLNLARATGDDSLATGIPSLTTTAQSDGTSLLVKGLEALSLLEHASQRLAVSSFLTSVLSTLSSSRGSLLELISRLRPGEEAVALQAIDLLLAQAANDHGDSQSADTSSAQPSRLASTLRPFFIECLGMRPNPASEAKRPLKYAPAKTTPADLKRTQSLLWPTRCEVDQARDSDEEDEIDSASKDPVTGSVLWKSPASCGLPLRPDWPLLALDDLLRSAESAVFNRADNLPADWDPTERQVVQAALHLMNWCCADAKREDNLVSVMPGLTSTHLYLGAQKVFMLESGIQGDPRKWTGAVTGKDLFRDATVAPLLRILMTVHANALARQEFSQPQRRDLSCQPPTLDQLAPQHFGEETSYYSFYTDLISLYDSISYGDELFALALLPPLATRLHQDLTIPTASSSGNPVDYRRLFWKDYAHLLPTIRTSIESAPGGSERYLPDVDSASSASPSHYTEETEMLQAYTTSVLEGRIGPDQQGLLWSIATHHIAAAIWPKEASQSEDARAKSLAGAVFSQGSKVLQEAVLNSVVNDLNGQASEDQVAERIEWLKTSCGIATVKVV